MPNLPVLIRFAQFSGWACKTNNDICEMRKGNITLTIHTDETTDVKQWDETFANHVHVIIATYDERD